MKHRQILTANCEQAEDEVKRIDEIFHDTVNQVLQVSMLRASEGLIALSLSLNLMLRLFS